MDFQAFVDSVGMGAVVMSVEKTPDGHAGEIRFVCANARYRVSAPPGYRDGILYTDIIAKEPNFEDFCFRCAVKKQYLHAYVESKDMNLWTDSTYIPIDTPENDDHLYYFLFCLEVTQELDSRRRAKVSMENASFVIQTCLNLRGSNNFVESMQKVVTDIRDYTDAFSCCVFLVDSDRKKAAPLCAKYRNDAARIEDFAKFLTYDVVSSWIDTVKGHDEIILKDEHDFNELAKRNPVWVESLHGAGVKSLIFVPLLQGENVIGFLFITNFNTDKLVEIKEFIELTTFFISSEVANNNMVEQLAYMSTVDSLTGVNNRNAMNTRIDYHINGKQVIKAPFGVIFTDLNGLKRCNDLEGHESGDRLLQNAAACLQAVFSDNEIYRAGGDEFVVLLQNCPQDEFEAKLSRIKQNCGYGSPVCFAVGAQWSDGRLNLRQCMHNADEAMYENKQAFYKAHPDFQHK
ncbi:MAG: sensor domain-containing diguanylate cyclase [Treponema sp.]|nr:sensor domain-containing diguanylate cyclase [Treponema sp.]